jgi:microcystin-dependent protein
MSQNFLGEIRMFGGNFAPRGWAFCHGQSLSIAQYDALYSLIGTTYGGDGQTTFNLPDLQSRIPVGQGQGPGLTPRVLGQTGGTEEVTLTVAAMPAHAHLFNASTATASSPNVSGNIPATLDAPHQFYTVASQGHPDPTPIQLAGSTIQSAGNGMPHENLMPLLCVNYIIALEGIYPSRN